MSELEKTYKEYTNEFSLLTIEEKKQENMNELQNTLKTINEIAKVIGIKENHNSTNSNEASTDNEYFMQMFHTINAIQETVGNILEVILPLPDDKQ